MTGRCSPVLQCSGAGSTSPTGTDGFVNASKEPTRTRLRLPNERLATGGQPAASHLPIRLPHGGSRDLLLSCARRMALLTALVLVPVGAVRDRPALTMRGPVPRAGPFEAEQCPVRRRRSLPASGRIPRAVVTARRGRWRPGPRPAASVRVAVRALPRRPGAPGGSGASCGCRRRRGQGRPGPWWCRG